MVGIQTKWNKIQITATVYPEHAKLLELILRGEYSKPIAHQSVSEILRRAIEHYAMFLGVDFEKIREDQG
ncbi:hypothetical protein Ferp_2049 [Ferroglobus placidus DSM 10642]|uniref:Uncharacterized protein n=1 Tax=Ferroglobus placidus (strain DSM 10642 / AEDII12DO) TaxID=589924 RepID=D3S0C0_FERPA|nr:hypothetical protein [Ferroglobus placidus]ADC66183.1 hypothetical protein Ferp_2049 [Ferroglobus placidus DSM 10642]